MRTRSSGAVRAVGRLVPLALVIAWLSVAVGCGEPGGAPAAGPDAPCTELSPEGPPVARNLVLVVSDTMRRDRMGAHGGRAHTPAFDGFARDHLLFTRAHTQAPWTKPSIATLFTGLYPSQHGVLSHPDRRFFERSGGVVMDSDGLADDYVTLAEVLQAAGYRTAAFVSNPWLQESFGFAQGFDVYDDSFAANETPGDVVTAAGLGWLERLEPGAPFFLYLHYMDAHGPPTRLRREEVEARRAEIASDRRPLPVKARQFIRQVALYEDGTPVVEPGLPPNRALLELLYDAGVERFDRAFGALLAGLGAHPAWDETALVVTSDHGEALFERGWYSHGNALYEDETAIPLAARLPGVPAAEISCSVGLIDLKPTLCTYLGIACGEVDFGTSLIASGEEPETRRPRYVISEGVIERPRARSLANARFKLIWDPDGNSLGNDTEWALFALDADPDETRDLLAREHHTPESERVFRTLEPVLREGVPEIERPESHRVPVDDETRERLENLGYIE